MGVPGCQPDCSEAFRMAVRRSRDAVKEGVG